MVVKMMKWRLSSKKFDTKITVHQLKGLQSSQFQDSSRFCVEIKWKGSKGIGFSSLRRSVRRNFTKEESFREYGIVEWNEEFQSVCNLSGFNGVFHHWEVSFTVFNGLKQGPNNKVPIVGSASLNLSDFASASENQGKEINIPLVDGVSLHLSVILQELRNAEEHSQQILRPVLFLPRSPCYGEAFSTEKGEISTRKSSPIKVNIFKGLYSLKVKRTSHEEDGSDGRSSVRSEFNYQLDTDSLGESDEGELDEANEHSGFNARKSFTYGTLAYANHVRVGIYSNTSGSEDEDWIYYSHRKSDMGPDNTNVSEPEKSTNKKSKRRFLPWRKRKLGFRSPKVRGEPLLKKNNGEVGGDDIDFDRRLLSSSDESTFGSHQKTEEISVANQPSESGFGDDNFAVGTWEPKEIISRDGHMKLKTQVFFASIDQRSERAAGESACTALVAVVTDWLQSHQDEMPIKSQLDSLIREGSLEWRNLCENESYKEIFPDKHFDLETVLEAKVRPLSIVQEKSFVGFFHPERLEHEGFNFLKGAMSFDDIWKEIWVCASKITESPPLVYIISWNDHFFVLKVDRDAYYIIDTLGERLYEGCNQAYILKFDKDTIIDRITNETEDKVKESKVDEGQMGNEVVLGDDAQGNGEEETGMVCSGKESCKEYIKSFLAAIPIRELQVDLKKGLTTSTTLHQRLQIEFHYTRCSDLMEEHQQAEETEDEPIEFQLPAFEPEEL